MVAQFRCTRWFFNSSKWQPSREEWTKLMSCIVSEERERVGRFVFKDDAKNALIGRILIRKYLSVTLGTHSNALQLTRTQKGRPILIRGAHDINNDALDFNVSHSGDYCVLAGLQDLEPVSGSPPNIGVDVMRIVSKNTKPEFERFLSLMKRREFLPREWAIVEKATTDRQKCVNFTRLWCLKESFIKAEGSGLGFGLDRICFTIKSDRNLMESGYELITITDTSVEIDNNQTSEWLFEESMIDNDHLVTIAICSKKLSNATSSALIPEGKFHEISIESLTSALTPVSTLDEEIVWQSFVSKCVKKY